MYDMDRREFLRIGTAGTGIICVPPALMSACTRVPVIAKPAVASKSRVAPLSGNSGYFESNFGVTNDMLGKTISRALSRGGDYADIYLQHKVSDYVGFEDGQVNRAYIEVDLGAGVRVLKGDQTGYAFTEDLSTESLIKAADTAASIAAGSSSSDLPSFTAIQTPELYQRERVWVDIPPDRKIGIVEAVGSLVLAGDPNIIKVSVFALSEDDVCLIATSDGNWAEDIRPMTAFYVTCTAEKDSRLERYTYRVAAREGIDFYSDNRIKDMATQAVQRTLNLFAATAPPAGEMPVVLAPATSGILLHEAIGHGMEADFNRKGTSIYATMIGKKVAEDFVTIVDTALEPNSRGAIHVDDEGIPGQRTVLVENGTLVSYLHDKISSKFYNVPPTGNGRRESFRHAPLPRMRVTTMENGIHDPEEIIKSVKKGLYAADFSNGEVTIGAGDYSFYVKQGYLIEDGKLTQPIKDANLIGNGPDTLKKTVMVGNDKSIDTGSWTCGKNGQSVPVSLGLPTVKVSSITVGGVNR
ncbi:MAG: metallopeptidase TldD-related protein [Myxococcota bacterium]|nr:metallopeptidase TldD-related protein [Myxococcota bacterium]